MDSLYHVAGRFSADILACLSSRMFILDHIACCSAGAETVCQVKALRLVMVWVCRVGSRWCELRDTVLHPHNSIDHVQALVWRRWTAGILGQLPCTVFNLPQRLFLLTGAPQIQVQ